jgi:hypothetical protein
VIEEPLCLEHLYVQEHPTREASRGSAGSKLFLVEVTYRRPLKVSQPGVEDVLLRIVADAFTGCCARYV